MEVFTRFQAASDAIARQCPEVAEPFTRRMPSAVHVGDRVGFLSGGYLRVISTYWVIPEEPTAVDFNTQREPVGMVVELAP